MEEPIDEQVSQYERERFILDVVAQKPFLYRYKVHTKTATRYISKYLACRDLEEMIVCLDSLKLMKDLTKANAFLVTALWEKVLVGYGKLFLAGDGFSKLVPDDYFKEDSMQLHEAMMTVRHSYLAHRGHNEFEYYVMLADLVGTEDNCRLELFVPGYKKMGHYFEPVAVRQHVKNLHKKLKRELSEQVSWLHHDLAFELGLEPNQL
jgi:hypothetical protein